MQIQKNGVASQKEVTPFFYDNHYNKVFDRMRDKVSGVICR